jgi:large subunit ribosomal protein L35
MPKPIARSKTKKSVAKRFKITATGKVQRSKAGRRHLLECKSSKLKRNMGKSAIVEDCDVSRIKLNLPWG